MVVNAGFKSRQDYANDRRVVDCLSYSDMLSQCWGQPSPADLAPVTHCLLCDTPGIDQAFNKVPRYLGR